MASDHNENDFGGMTRREALLAAGGLSMMGFCSACEAGEIKMTSGAATAARNISKAAPNNAVIQQMQTAAGLFKNGSFSGVKVSTENVVSKVQELFHKGEAAKKLGRDRSVVRNSAAAIEDSDKARVLSHFSSEGFSSSDLQGAQVFFTRSSLLDHSRISNVKDLSVDKAVAHPPLNNTNLNTLTALSFDQKSNTLKTNILMNAGRGAIQISILNFAFPKKKPDNFPLHFIDPPVFKDPSLIGRIRVNTKVFKLVAPSSGASGSSSSNSGESSGSGSTDTSDAGPFSCLNGCMTGVFDEAVLEAVGWLCTGCFVVLYTGGIVTDATLGLAGPAAVEAITIACGGCAVATIVGMLACFLGCALN